MEGKPMPRQLRDSKLDSRSARLKLTPQGRPYFRKIDHDVSLGYRRISNQNGTWLRRSWSGGKYQDSGMEQADDYQDSDGETVLTFWEAIERLRGVVGKTTSHDATRFSVADAMAHYLQMLEGEHRSAHSLVDIK